VFEQEIVEIEIRVKGKDQTMIMTIPRAEKFSFELLFEEPKSENLSFGEVCCWATQVKSMSVQFKPLSNTGRYGTMKVVDNEPPA
jgi:hypothetical protein